jgi:Protein of unknown function (DUF3025)
VEVAGLSDVDWSGPWFAPFADAGRTISSTAHWRDELDRAAHASDIRNQCGQRIQFVPAGAAGDEPYETYIARTGKVPTRAMLHDIFNALVWLRFPRSKARLNSLQASAIACHGVGATRGPLRDALTLIDENAVLVVTRRTDLIQLLRVHQWAELFVKQRAAWDTGIYVAAVGHALLEKLVSPYKAITAHALHVPMAADAPLDEIDRCIAAALNENLSPGALMPLPVLGIPGWSSRNNDPNFYEDPAVFRPVNMRRKVQRRELNR